MFGILGTIQTISVQSIFKNWTTKSVEYDIWGGNVYIEKRWKEPISRENCNHHHRDKVEMGIGIMGDF